MTPAEQQVLAAWVSAGAAVVQAVGAVAAIIAAVVLARQSAARERAAAAAAEGRAVIADERAEARSRAADEAAEVRRRAQADAAHDSVIDRFLGLARAAVVDLAEEGRREAEKLGGELGWIQGGLGGRGLASLKAVVPDLRRETDDAAVMIALDKVSERLTMVETFQAQGFGAYAATRANAIAGFEASVADVAALRRGSHAADAAEA